MKKKRKNKEESMLLKLMIVCVALSIIMLGVVVYEKIIKNDCKNICETYLNK